MYIGNLSDFFYKNKSWLINQPKFSVESNKKNNTIMKIGKKYYNLNSVTGKLELIKTNNISPKNISILFDTNNSISKENKKDKKQYFPEIFNNIEKKRNIKSQNNKSENANKNVINSLFQENNKNKSIDNINKTYNFFSFEKNESNLLNNSNTSRKEQTSTDNNDIINKLINIKNTNNKYNKSINTNHTRQSSLKLNTESKFKNEVIKKIKSENIKYLIKYQKNKKSIDNKKIETKLLSKRNIKKIIEKRQRDNDELKTNNTYTNTSNNNTNVNKSSTYNIKSTPNYYNRTINLKKQITPLNMNQKEFINKFFPNSDSLSIKKDDSWFLKTIKNQLFKDRTYTKLKKKFEFYQDSQNKRDIFIVPKINIKKTIMLSKKDIFPDKETVYRKLFFEYINKQKQTDNKDKCFFNY